MAHSNFHYGCDVFEVVCDYVYRGITMNYNNKYEKAIRKQLDQGRKAQFSLLVNAKKLELSIDIQCNLLKKLVFPIMLYSCEIWETNLRIVGQYLPEIYICLNLHLRPSTPSCMIYDEVRKLPLQVTIDKRPMSFGYVSLMRKNLLWHILYT